MIGSREMPWTLKDGSILEIDSSVIFLTEIKWRMIPVKNFTELWTWNGGSWEYFWTSSSAVFEEREKARELQVAGRARFGFGQFAPQMKELLLVRYGKRLLKS